MVFASILPVIVFLSICLIIGIVLLTRPKAKAFEKVIAVILLIPLLFVGIKIFAPRAIPISHNLVEQPDVYHAVELSSAGTSVNPSIWHEAIGEKFKADIYHSEAGAAQAIGRDLGKWMQEHATKVERVWFSEEPKQLNPESLHAIVQGINQCLEDKDIRRCQMRPFDSESMKDANWANIKLRFERHHEGNQQQTRLVAEIVAPNRKKGLLQVNYIEKPWLTNLAQYVNEKREYPHSSWVIAQSTGSCTTPQEARQQAIQSACEQVRMTIYNQHQHDVTVSESDLYENDLITDQFTQSLHGLAGPIWRQAFLVDLAPNKLNQLAEAHVYMQRKTYRTWAYHLASGLGLTLLIFVLYIFLNAATRGYYTWSLRIAAVVVVAATLVLTALIV